MSLDEEVIRYDGQVELLDQGRVLLDTIKELSQLSGSVILPEKIDEFLSQYEIATTEPNRQFTLNLLRQGVNKESRQDVYNTTSMQPDKVRDDLLKILDLIERYQSESS